MCLAAFRAIFQRTPTITRRIPNAAVPPPPCAGQPMIAIIESTELPARCFH
jgi:hypothetical protein